MRSLVLECGEAAETPETLQSTWDNYITAGNVKGKLEPELRPVREDIGRSQCHQYLTVDSVGSDN